MVRSITESTNCPLLFYTLIITMTWMVWMVMAAPFAPCLAFTLTISVLAYLSSVYIAAWLFYRAVYRLRRETYQRGKVNKLNFLKETYIIRVENLIIEISCQTIKGMHSHQTTIYRSSYCGEDVKALTWYYNKDERRWKKWKSNKQIWET